MAVAFALRTPDIISEVFSHCENVITTETEPDFECWKTLARCAYTCRAFNFPALEVLWRHLWTLDPFLTLINVPDAEHPSSNGKPGEKDITVWFPNVVATSVLNNVQIMQRTITTENKRHERFTYYASFVRSVCISGQSCVDPSLFKPLSKQNVGKPLLPNLHCVHLWDCWAFADTPLLLLAGPSLSILVIGCSSGRVHLAVSDSSRHQPELLLLPILDFPCLKSVDLSKIPLRFDILFLRGLSQLKHLSRLKVNGTFITDDWDRVPCDGFSELRELTVCGGVSTVINLLKAMPSVSLSYFDIRLGAANSHDMTKVFEAIPTSSLITMRSLAVHHEFEFGPQETPTGLLDMIKFVGPLLNMKRLESFHYETPCLPLAVKDTDLRALGKDLPQLRSLKFLWDEFLPGYQCLWDHIPLPSFGGILELTRICPDLSHVHLSAFEELKTLSGKDLEPLQPFNLPHLEDGDNPVRVAHILRSLVGQNLILPIALPKCSGRWGAVIHELTKA